MLVDVLGDHEDVGNLADELGFKLFCEADDAKCRNDVKYPWMRDMTWVTMQMYKANIKCAL